MKPGTWPRWMRRVSSPSPGGKNASPRLAERWCLMPEWKRKFTRPRKKIQVSQPILVLESDEKAMFPPETRYRQHYAFWKSWHSDLLDSYGQLRKRDVRYLSGSIGELRAMAELLQGPPAERMKEVLTRLTEIEDTWRKRPEPWNPPATTRTELDKIRREVEKKLQYGKVKKWIVSGTSGSAKP